jgi:4-hydroxy-2-oxoheptanedioate aldolase
MQLESCMRLTQDAHRTMFSPSKLLAKIRAGKVARVCVTGSPLAYMPAMAAHYGYDGVWIDAEHRAWDPLQVREMILRTHHAGIDCVFRPSSTDSTALSRYLEDGVTALMIPMVNTPERARELVSATKFPPLGERGLDGSGLDAGFAVGRSPDYVQQANRETALIVMIESPEGVANVADIAAVEGVDLVFMGPGDLSLRLGCTPSLADPKLRTAIERMAENCRKHGKPWGYPVATIEDARTVVSMGAQFINFGGEFSAVMKELETCSANWENAFQS